MLEKRNVFEIHRLKTEGYSVRSIASMLGCSRNTINKYLEKPEQVFKKKGYRLSKLDPHRDHIKEFLEKEPSVSAPVVLQKLQKEGFDGKITIVRSYLRELRGERIIKNAYIRFESPAGKQMQLDWGHFNSIDYENATRKMYALAICECYSRMLYVEFTHSQKQEVLHQCLLNAFQFFGGTPYEIVVDNMATAVVERVGKVIRFNDSFLDFLRRFSIVPKACHVRAPYEKGKIERSIRYIRQNFWPLRKFSDIFDVNKQVKEWLNDIANVRVHQTTGEKPKDRFKTVTLRELPEDLPDYRETTTVKVHKDFAVHFDQNTYTVPPWTIGKHITLKADNATVTLYYKQKRVATHHRCYAKKKRIEIQSHIEQVKRLEKKLWQDQEISLFVSLGDPAQEYVESLVKAQQPIKKTITRLISLYRKYGTESIISAVTKALQYKAYGADYIENILYQERTPKADHPPVKLSKNELNHIQLTMPNLAEYDAYILKGRKDD